MNIFRLARQTHDMKMLDERVNACKKKIEEITTIESYSDCLEYIGFSELYVHMNENLHEYTPFKMLLLGLLSMSDRHARFKNLVDSSFLELREQAEHKINNIKNI